MHHLAYKVLCLALVIAAAVPSHAQPAAPSARIVSIGEKDLDVTADWPQNSGADAISLDVTQAQLETKPQTWDALAKWVAEGGVVILHTDAARTFGYSTIEARERTRDVAGQLFGRARAPLPFGAHPLLWGAASNSLEGRTSGVMGVQLVFYKLQKGDHLVTQNPSGIGLLRVTDAAQPSATPLFAAAIAPYGQGWTIFAPRLIEARADGPVWNQNLSRFIALTPASLRRREQQASPEVWTSVSLEPIRAAFEQAGKDEPVKWSFLAREFENASQPLPQSPANGTAQAVAPIATAPRFLLTRSEAALFSSAFENAAAKDADAASNQLALALLTQLETRRIMQSGIELTKDTLKTLSPFLAFSPQRRLWIEQSSVQAQSDVALLSTTRLWNGIFAAAVANTFGTAAIDQRVAFAEAASWWRKSLGQAVPIQGALEEVENVEE